MIARIRGLIALLACLWVAASNGWAAPPAPPSPSAATPKPSGAPSATDDAKRDEVVQMRVGETRELVFADLVRFTVGDYTMLVVRGIAGDKVRVAAVRPGQTWLEVVHGGRVYTAVRVVVEPAPVAATSPLASAAASAATPDPSPSAGPSPETTTSSSPAATAPPSASSASDAPATPSASPSPSPGANERVLTLEPRALSIGLEPAYGVDTQTFPTLVTYVDANGDAYVEQVSTKVKRQFVEIPITLDWSPGRDDRLSAVFPYVNSEQVTTGPYGSAHARASGLGDIGLGWEHTFGRRPVGGWETGALLSVTFPTGRSVYDITSADALPLGTGHYQVGTGLVVRRLADPLAIYGSVGVSYTLPREFSGQRVSPGVGFTASSGVTWAMSDRWSLSEQISYMRRPNIFLASPTLTVTQNVDQAYLTQAVTYSSRRGDFLLRLMLSAGLNDASTDFVGGISAQWRR